MQAMKFEVKNNSAKQKIVITLLLFLEDLSK